MTHEEFIKELSKAERTRDWKAAYAVCDEHFKNTGAPLALVHACVALLRDGNLDRFQSTLDRLIRLKPKSPDIFRLKALAAETTGKLEEALTLWRRYSELARSKPEPHLRIAAIYLREQEYLRLLRQFEVLLDKFPDHPKLRTIQDDLAEIVQLESAGAIRTRAMALMQKEEWRDARAAWELLYVKTAGDVNALTFVCDAHLRQSNYRECRQIINEHLGELRTAKRFDEILRRTAFGLIADGTALRETLDASLVAEISAASMLTLIRALGREGSDDDLAYLCSGIQERDDPALLVQAAAVLANRDKQDWALRLVERAQEIGETSIDDDLLALHILERLGERDRTGPLLRKFGASPDMIVANNDRFVRYTAAYVNLFGVDDKVRDLIRLASRTLLRVPGNRFALVTSLAKSSRPEFLAFLFAEMTDAAPDIAGSEELYVLREIYCPPEEHRPEAEETLLQALRNFLGRDDPDNLEKVVGIADRLHASKRHLLLDRVLTLSVELKIESPKLTRIRAQLLTTLGRWSEAASIWGQIAARDPDDDPAHIARILALRRSDQLEDAREEFGRLIKLRQDKLARFPTALATCAMQLGELGTAKRLAIGHFEKSGGKTIAENQRIPLARVLGLTGYPQKALDLYPPRDVLDKNDTAKLAIVLDPGLTATSGHHVNYTLFAWSMIDELRRDGANLSPVVLCTKNVEDVVELADLRIVRALAFEPYAYEQVPELHHCLANLNRMFYRDLLSLELVDRAGLIIVHSMKATMIEGFSRWVDDIFRSTKGVVVISLIEVDHLMETEDVGASFASIYLSGLRRLAGNPNVSLFLYVETQFGKNFLDRLAIPNLDVKVFPYLAASLCTRHKSRGRSGSEEPIVLGTVGGTRPSRGSYLFPGLIERTQDLSARCAWKLHLNIRQLTAMTEAQDRPLIAKMAGAPNVEIVDDVLSTNQYFELLDEIDVVVLPYQGRYAVSGSGVFYESLYMGKFLLVSRDSFMPAVLAGLGHPHMVIEENTLDSLEKSVRSIVEEQDTIKRQLAELRASDRQRLPADDFYEILREKIRRIG